MSRIRVLPEEVSNRIAAGEVIERPASVVKELVDNALDAGATRIRVATESGGRNLVAVTDDGCGMDSEDALLCLEAHATSKLRQAEDLAGIETLGFRGEAMPSIASVSRFQLRTRLRDAESGTEVLVNGGTIDSVRPVGCAPGTSVYVRNLFYNLPARRKFLRTVPTEEAHIEEAVLSQALAHPKIGFDLEFDGRSIISVHSGSDLRTRAAMLIGKDAVENMVEVRYGGDGVDVWGFVARPGITRASRREQRTFVNGRPVASDTLYHGIREAYHTLVSKGRYPPVVLFLSVDPTSLDVNVHPAKREVRFHDGRGVGRIVAAALEQALRQQMTGGVAERLPRLATPRFDSSKSIGPDAKGDGSPLPSSTLAPARAPLTPAPLPQLPAVQQVLPISHDQPAATTGTDAIERLADAAADQKADGSSPAGDVLGLRLIGQLGDRYLLAEGPRGLVVIDRRAAHERILYEQLLAAADQEGDAGQGLLIPVTLSFGTADADVLRRNVDRLMELGFDLSDFGGNSFLLSAVPARFPQENLAAMMREMVDLLRQESGGGRRLDRRRLAQLAGSAALQAQDRLDELEKDKLLADLAATELPYVCPKGKPTIITVPHSELLRRFGRR